MSKQESPGPEMRRPLRLREVTVPNRIWMSPMAQYSAGADGKPTDWHLVHYGARAVGGAGLVMVEATAVGPSQRTTSADLGIWNEEQAAAHRRLTSFIAERGAVPAIQLLAAGRKGSHQVPWEGEGQNGPVSVADGGWQTIGPSAVPLGDLSVPREADRADMDEVVEAFAQAVRMSHLAGYEAVEIHAAHGYIVHQFLSPLSNHRTDEYGGSLQNRMRLPLRVARAVREAFPAEKPVFFRVTATDWAEGGITPDEAATFAKELAAVGIDLLDISSGGAVRSREARAPAREGVHVGFADALKTASGLAVAPVGQIGMRQAGELVADGRADAVLMGRPLLRDPYLPLRDRPDDKAAWPRQYHRALV
ncbi:NADH:flavin oxidoreductase/NADH oxidase [Streptomyces iconiensis]|uniref:NADH:flavin oxidoreductase/NADH oxidase n=1 Tax=Streptomyces iconiensis TaxID=1384038 RepID=A0ABT6ZTC0_9ACTN|nr:NADH:flavin oxidoreductase/NADH oxidase [Streptomyces iconiensis]MDJ1132299.1 NADH:flavin oxidoreductase/NADH oxidase [Streptomyces iconiensis]